MVEQYPIDFNLPHEHIVQPDLNEPREEPPRKKVILEHTREPRVRKIPEEKEITIRFRRQSPNLKINKLMLHVTNIKFSITPMDIKIHFEKYGNVDYVKLLLDEYQKSRGIAFIKFTNEEDAAKAMRCENKKEWETRPLLIGYAVEKPQMLNGKRRKVPYNNENSVYVGNLPYATEKQKIMEMFGKFGEIEDIRMPITRDGICKGFAHIKYQTSLAASKALRNNGCIIDGRCIKVERVSSYINLKQKNQYNKQNAKYYNDHFNQK